MVEYGEHRLMCDKCPLVWGLETRLKLDEKYGDDPQIEYCGCDKTGNGRFCVCGFCSEAFVENEIKQQKDKPRRTGRAYRREQARKKDRRKRKIIEFQAYRPCIGYIDYNYVDGKWQPGNHIKYPKNSNAQQYLKRQSNKRVRNYEGEIHNGNAYRRLFDYWWKLY